MPGPTSGSHQSTYQTGAYITCISQLPYSYDLYVFIGLQSAK